MSGDASAEASSSAAAENESKPQALFRDITADEYDPEITEMESLCVNCEEQGTTRLFLTKIPFFREVIVSSFSCDHCGLRNAELQSAGRIQDKGCRYTVNVQTKQDLNRQVVRSPTSTVRIPELDFEAPPKKGGLTTVEGIIMQALEDLNQCQEIRRIQTPEIAAQIDEFIAKMQKLLELKTSFHIVLEDPAGNSFVENPHAPTRDLQMTVQHFTRTRQQNIDLCCEAEDAEEEEESAAEAAQPEKEVLGTKDKDFDTTQEVLHFATNCPHCNAPCHTNMKLVNIPYFKEVVIMATNCEACGHRDNEVKSGGGMEEKGRKITLNIQSHRDMTRDVLKSETCSIMIPALEMETSMGTLGGKFTTVEGLLDNIKEQLKGNPFMSGDSSQPIAAGKLSTFCEKVDKIIQGELVNIDFILDDPAGNSYIQSLTTPDPDPQLIVEDYVRSFEQNEELGINDMKTEGYEQN